jgi:hypothetical protein
MKKFRLAFAITGCFLSAMVYWWKASDGNNKFEAKVATSDQNFGQLFGRKIDLNVRNGASLEGKEVLTELTAQGLFYQNKEGLEVIVFNKVNGNIKGQGNILPNWTQFRDGSLVIKKSDSLSEVAWIGHNLGEIEWNLLRLFANFVPPLDKIVNGTKTSYRLDDLFGQGNWNWSSKSSDDGSTKWTSSFIPENVLNDELWNRSSNWTIQKNLDSIESMAHEVIELTMPKGANLLIDAKGVVKFGPRQRIDLKEITDSNLVFLSLRPDARPDGSSNSKNSKSKDEIKNALLAGNRSIYLDLKHSLDAGEWGNEEILELAKSLDRKGQAYKDLIGALSQSRLSASKMVLLEIIKGLQRNTRELVAALPLLAQNDVNGEEIYSWLDELSEKSDSSEVQTTSRLAIGTLGFNSRKNNPALSERILESSIEKLQRMNDKNDLNAMSDILSTIGNVGGSDLDRHLEQWLHHPNDEIRAAAYFAIRHDTNSKNGFDKLYSGVNDTSSDVRYRVASAMEMMQLDTAQYSQIAKWAGKENDARTKTLLSEMLKRKNSHL